MPVVTALERHHRHKERVKLYLDDEYAFQLPLLDAAMLRCGQDLSQAEMSDLMEAGALQQACERAVRLLARRPRSEAELRRKLSSKSTPPLIIDNALEKLRSQGYVDDAAFARYWVEQRGRHKPMAARALRYQLRQKGVADGDIDAALAGLDEADAAWRAAQSRLWRCRGQTRTAFRRQLSQWLLRRGFSGETIYETIQRCLDDLAETELDYFIHDDQN